MKIIKPSFEILTIINGFDVLKRIEKIGRVCYKSEDRVTDTSAEKFVKAIMDRGHHSVIEHENVSIKFIFDRGISHEAVRHRIAAHSQESTRFCCYANDKFGNELTFIDPIFWSSKETDNKDLLKYNIWLDAMAYLEEKYLLLIELGTKPEEARSILPNSLKTELVVTANLREWRHILKLRTSGKAHPQMREVMIPLLNELYLKIPVIFDDIYEDLQYLKNMDK